MLLDNKHEIEIVIIEKKKGAYGDVSNDLQKFKAEHPDSEYQFGCRVINKENGLIPEGCNDWNDTVEEAIWDYVDNVQGKEN